MSIQVALTDPYDVLKKAHITIMRHRETYLYSGVLMLGESTISDNVATAATNGRDKFYNKDFIMRLTPEEVTAIVLHEGLHVFLKHMMRHTDLMAEDARLANAAMDYVVNDIIVNLKDKSLAKLPKGGLYDAKFHDWSVREIYNYLKTGKNKQGDDEGEPEEKEGDDGETEEVIIGPSTFPTKPMDEHQELEGLSEGEEEELGKEIDKAIQESALLAGMTGGELPRAISELLQPKLDWREVLNEYLSARLRGVDEFTFAKFNRKRVVSGLYRPSTYNERIGRIVVAFDTSASISQEQINEFTAELAAICGNVVPEEVVVLWWDTRIAGEQHFSEDYTNLVAMLKPSGFGGTRVSCVSEYMVRNNVEADALVVFTDGYVESDVNWQTTAPTLWVITQNASFSPPSGIKVDFK